MMSVSATDPLRVTTCESISIRDLVGGFLDDHPGVIDPKAVPQSDQIVLAVIVLIEHADFRGRALAKNVLGEDVGLV